MYNLNNDKIRRELLKQASQNSLVSAVALFINILIINIVFWDISSKIFLISWLLVISILLVKRSVLSKTFLTENSSLPLKETEHSYKKLTFIIGIIVGIGMVIVLPIGLAFHQAFLAMVVAGLSAGAVMSLSFYKDVVISYLLFLTLPFTYIIYSQGTEIHVFIALLMIIFLFVLITFSNGYNKKIIDIIKSKLLIEETKKKLEISNKKIRHQALHDYLTNLTNRLTLNDRLKQQLSHLKREKHFGAVLFIDIDQFKTINDSLGHYIGDELLKIFANRVLKIVRQGDTVSRLGGDEFVILLPDLSSKELEAINYANNVATKLHNTIKEPIDINGQLIYITVSIGVTIISANNKDVHEVLKHADLAMYKAKQQGRDTTCFFEEEMSQKIKDQLTLGNELRDAIKNNEFELYYQPIVQSNNHKIISCEALIRWNHPTRGLIYPDSFIPYAETSGFIIPIGDWVIKRACMDYKKLNSNIESMAINISHKQFKQESFISSLLETLKQYQLEPNKFKLELTESVAIESLSATIEKINELKSHGFSMAMDDFGTGYSSLSYLKNLPFDFLKIDRSFIMNILDNEDDASLVKTILSISEQFKFAVIAEGVETQEQIKFLDTLNCQYYQGYVISKPIPLKEFNNLNFD